MEEQTNMKQIAIKKVFGYFTTNTEEVESCVFDEKLEQLDREIKLLLKKYQIKFVESSTAFYKTKKYSLCFCENCKHLMINRDINPAGFSRHDLTDDMDFIVYNGGESEGKILCGDCLPVEHRWSILP